MAVSADVAWHARARGAHPAVVLADASVSYAQLDGWAADAAAVLAARGIGSGACCALVLEDSFALLVALLGCDRLGTTVALVDPSWPAALRSTALSSARPNLVVDTPLDVPGPGADGCDSAVLGEAGSRFLAAFTSGTTGAARAVVRSRRSWTQSFSPFSEITGIEADAVVLVPGPLHSTLFLFGALHALGVGATVVFAPLSTALSWTVAHLVPAMLTDLLRQPTALSGRTVVCAGAALPAELAEAASDRGLQVVEYYGAAELSFVAIGRPGEMRAFPGVEIDVRGDQDLPGFPGAGRVWVRSDYLSDGYLGGVEGPLMVDTRGFATVGDIGALSPTGHLVVHGRGDGLILTGGVSVLSEDVEAVLRTVSGVAAVVVVGTPHGRFGQIVTAVVEPADSRPELADLRARAEAFLAPAQRPRRWWLTGLLPRTSSGKVARGLVSRGLADGTLAAVPLR